jgi:isocitrate/isopropylmalate dehydrogenase
MLLTHLGEIEAAADVERAVAADLMGRADTKRNTVQIGDALAGAI